MEFKVENKKLWSECYHVTWPLILAMAGNALMIFVDRLFLSRYSTVCIQAALPSSMVSYVFMVFLQSVVAYSGNFVAQYSGAGARAACSRVLGQGLWLSLICVPVTLLMLPVGYWIFNSVGHAPEVVAAEKSYYLMLTIGNLTLPFASAFNGFFAGRGFTRMVMFANLAGNLLNIALDPILIWGWGKIPEMGILGAGLATSISQLAVTIALGVAAIREPHFATPFRRRVALALQPHLLMRIIRFGVPSGEHVLLDELTFSVFVFVTGRLPEIEFAASNITFAINNLIYAPLLGFGLAASILTGRYLGEQKPNTAARVARLCAKLGWCYIILCILVVGCCNSYLLKLFFPPDAHFAYADYLGLSRKLIAICLTWAIFDTANIVLGGALKGAGDTRFVMLWTTGISLFLWMPMLFAVYYFKMGVVWMWLTMLIYVVIVGGGICIRFLSGRWKKIHLIEDVGEDVDEDA